jgi:2-polyprenyl-6-methoxyphenol hydroxylase-like FAD-dependent oxidoreductase
VGLAALIHKKDEKPFKSGPVEKKFSLIEHRSPLFKGRRPSKIGAHLYKLWRGHAQSYSARGAVLLGDAVHVINPVMAQGMTMAIEDAAALADFVGPVLASNGGATLIDRSFEDYEAFRRPFNQAVIRHSHWMSCLFATNGFLGEGIVSLVRLIRGFSLCEHIQARVWASFARSPEFGD